MGCDIYIVMNVIVLAVYGHISLLVGLLCIDCFAIVLIGWAIYLGLVPTKATNVEVDLL